MAVDDAALDRLYKLIADQGSASSSALQTHNAQINAQFAAQNASLAVLGTSLARQEQKLEDNSARIFGSAGTPGFLQHFKEENEKRENEIHANTERIALVTKEVTTIKTTTIKEKAYVIGFATALSLALKVVLAKVGIHIGN